MIPIYYLTLAAGGLLVIVVMAVLMRGVHGLLRSGVVVAFVLALAGGALLFQRQRISNGPLTIEISSGPSVSVFDPPRPPRPAPEERPVRDLRIAEEVQLKTAEAARVSAWVEGIQAEFRHVHDTGGEPMVVAPEFNRRKEAPTSPRLRAIGIVVAALVVIAFLYVGYLFVDAGTRGQFTWLLRITSVIGFAGLCMVVAILRHRL